MFTICKNCNKTFTSIERCKRHIEKKICLKIIEKKWKKIKQNMKVCDKCGKVLSNQYSLDKHVTKQVSCIHRDLQVSLDELQKDFLEKNKIKRKKFLLKKEILSEKIGIENISSKDDSDENLENLSNEELIILLKEKIKIINNLQNNSLESNKSDDLQTKMEEKKIDDITIYDIIPITISKEQKEWDSIVKDINVYNAVGYWNKDNYIIKPVRHYSDYYNRSLLVRNMKSSKMLSSIICPHFYPNYVSSLDTKVYIDTTKKNSMWLLDDNQKWNSVSFTIAIKNMIFHSVSAYSDLIQREALDSTYWELEKETLENCNSENYKLVSNNLISRIPKLSIHPTEEEKKLINDLNDEYKIDIVTEISNEYKNYYDLPETIQTSLLHQRIMYSIRFKNKIKKAKTLHNTS